MNTRNNSRNSHASLILFIVVSLVLAMAALTLSVGPQYSPDIGVAAAKVLAHVDAAFKSALPTPWFRWFALWSVAGAALSVMIGLLILPRSAEAPSSFERGAIATAELSRIVVIVLAVGVSFFDFITAPKDTLIATSKRADGVRTTDAAPPKLEHSNTPAATEATPMTPATPDQQVEVATSDVTTSSSVQIEGQNQPLSAKAELSPQAAAQPPAQTTGQPSRFDAQAPAATQPQNEGKGSKEGGKEGGKDTASAATLGTTGAAGTPDLSVTNTGQESLSLGGDLLPWERSPRDSRLGSPTPGRPRQPSADRFSSSGTSGAYGTAPGQGGNGAPPSNGKGNGSQGAYASAAPNPRDERDSGRQQPGSCESVRGRFYNVRGRNNSDYEATIEIMSRGRGLIRLMTRRGEVVLMDARVTNCTGNKITIVGNNGRTEAGVSHETYKDDIFVAPYQRQSREDWGR